MVLHSPHDMYICHGIAPGRSCQGTIMVSYIVTFVHSYVPMFICKGDNVRVHMKIISACLFRIRTIQHFPWIAMKQDLSYISHASRVGSVGLHNYKGKMTDPPKYSWTSTLEHETSHLVCALYNRKGNVSHRIQMNVVLGT